MFDKSTWIKLPRNVVVGHGVLDELGQAVADLHLHGDPLVVTSPTPNEIAGDRLRDQLGDPSTVIVESASFDSIERVVAVAREVDADYLIALGGGKPIDIAKMAADEIDRGFVSVPTAASHDGIVSGRSSIPEGDSRHSIAADPPLAVVADTEIIARAPWELTTAASPGRRCSSTAATAAAGGRSGRPSTASTRRRQQPNSASATTKCWRR